jgi:hypothetical protein
MTFQFTRSADTLTIATDDLARDLKALSEEPKKDAAWQTSALAVLGAMGRLPKKFKEAPQMTNRFNERQTAEDIAKVAESRGEDLATTAADYYAAYRQRHNAAAERGERPVPSEQPSRFDAKHFNEEAVPDLKSFEEEVDGEARQLCERRGLVTNPVNIALMAAEIIEASPERYSRYVALQRRAAT